MVVIKNYSGTQIDNLPSVTGRVLYDSTLNALRYHNSTNYSSILAHKDANNNMSGVNNLRTTGNVGINTTVANKQVEINSSTGDCLRLTNNDSDGNATNYTDLLVSSSGNLTLTPSGGNINISSHNGSTTGLQLAGTLVTSTAVQLNYNSGSTPGTAVASKTLVVDSSRNIVNINALTASTLTGTLQTPSQTNVTSVGILAGLVASGVVNISSHDGSTTGLQLAGTLVTSTAIQLNYNAVTPGTTIASKTLVVDANRDLIDLNNLRTTGNLGINTSVADKQVEINSSTGDCLRLTYNDSNGTATNYSDLLISSSGDLLITPSGGNLDITSHNGDTTGLKLAGVLVTATAAQLNYNDITTPGIAEPLKTFVVDANRNVVNLNYVEVGTLVALKTGTANNAIDFPISLITLPVDSASIGLGTGIEFNSVNDNDDIYNAGYINYISSDITNGTESGFFDFKLANNGVIDSIFTISNNGVASATSYVETSDIRTKENIQETISVDSLAKILQVNVKTYNYKKDSDKRNCIGVIAQELNEIIPESVVISKNDDFDDFHQVHYSSLIPHLINCIKVLNDELQQLKAKL